MIPFLRLVAVVAVIVIMTTAAMIAWSTSEKKAMADFAIFFAAAAEQFGRTCTYQCTLCHMAAVMWCSRCECCIACSRLLPP
jgi:hypothetical protein